MVYVAWLTSMTGQVFLNRKHLIKVVFLGHGNEYNEQVGKTRCHAVLLGNESRFLSSFLRSLCLQPAIHKVCVICVIVWWNMQGRPEFGGLDPRWQFAAEQFQGNRAFWAFVLDLGLYSVWQVSPPPTLLFSCVCGGGKGGFCV